MISAVEPLVKTSYTEKGNKYKESNIGKYATGAGVAGTTLYYGGKYAYNAIKEINPKAKIIKMDLSKILGNALKPQIKKDVTVIFGEKGASIVVNSKKVNKVTEFITENAEKINKENIKKAGQMVVDFVTTNAKKVNTENVKKAGKSFVDFITTNAKKINKENIKKAGEAIIEFAKKPSVKYGAVIAAAFAGILAIGYLADKVANKISAYKADKA